MEVGKREITGVQRSSVCVRTFYSAEIPASFNFPCVDETGAKFSLQLDKPSVS